MVLILFAQLHIYGLANAEQGGKARIFSDKSGGILKTSYEPFDGDYIDADYGKLLNDIQSQQGLDIGAHLEICVSMTQDNNKIYVLCSNDEGSEWEYSYVFEIPNGWELEQVREMFLGNVYLRTDEYVKPEQEEEEEEE